MKKCIVSILIFSCTVLPGCSLLQLPGMILQELVPMVIQYAPYALMFIEETNEKVIAHNSPEQFHQELSNIPESPKELKELSYIIRENLAQKNMKFQSIYILNLKNLNKQQILDIYREISKKGKVHYKFAKVSTENSHSSLINELNSETTIPIHTASASSLLK